MSTERTNQQRVYAQLEQMSQLEQRIKTAGITTIKPLAEELARRTRQTLALLSMEVFNDG